MITILTIVVVLLIINAISDWVTIRSIGNEISGLQYRLRQVTSDSNQSFRNVKHERDQLNGKLGETISKINQANKFSQGLADYLGVEYVVTTETTEGFEKIKKSK